MAEVIIKNVKKIYSGNVTAVHDFNLHIKDKEFIVFVGPSGCGKSTTLRMVAGLEDISEGIVTIDGEVVNDLQPKDRHISMVFQNYALYPHLTVYENMAFPLRLDKKERIMPLCQSEREKAERDLAAAEAAGNSTKAAKIRDELENGRWQKGYTNDQIYERVTSAAQVLGITPFLTRKPKAMSGGQRQRVAIGRAMVKDCKVFLMDEPLSNLDAKLRNQMRAEIILLRKRINTTFIYVTHDQTEAMTLGDRIVCMKDGFIMQVGTPTELFDMPANLFVAQFVGAPMMNTVNCDLIKEGNQYFVNPYGYRLPVGEEKGKALLDRGVQSRPIILGIRPEHIQLASGNDGIPVTIQVNEMMGSEYHLHVTTENDDKLIVRIPTLSLSDEERASMVNGTQIKVAFSGKAMHFFDPESEKNLLVDITNADAYELDADIIHAEKQEELPKAEKEE